MIALQVNGVEYPLPIQTDDLQHRLDALYDAGRLSELVDPHAHLAGFKGDWPTPPFTEWPRPRLGSIYWPVVGYARYAFACLLVDEYTVGQIRAGMIAANSNAVTVILADEPDDLSAVTLDENGDPVLDENGDPVMTESPAVPVAMRFLATRPLVRTTSDPLTAVNNGTDPVDAWVLLLVDNRYAALHAESPLAYGTWAELFTAGSVVTADGVDTDYLTPSARWSDARLSGRSKAWALDIAAMSVGSRIVTVPGASPQVQRPTAFRAATLAAIHTAAAADDRHTGGGSIENNDVAFGFPDDAKVTFGLFDEPTPVTVTVTGIAYWPAGTTVPHWADPPAVTGSALRSALAAQWAVDWEAWQRNLYDTTYAGFVEAPSSGFCWAVEWFHSAGQAYTKFVRPPHWWGYLLPPHVGGATADAIGCGLTYDGDDVIVDVPSLAGPGLEPTGDTPCNKLQVAIGCNLTLSGNDVVVDTTALAGDGLVSSGSPCPTLSVGAGCGISVSANAVGLNLTDVAQDGLYWDNINCVLGIDFDPCTLTLVGNTLTVDLTNIADDRAETGLVTRNNGDCDTLAFDDETFSTTTETLVTDTTISLSAAGVLTFTKTRVTYTNYFNEQGVLINRTAGSPTVTTYNLDICALDCCDEAPVVGEQDFTVAGDNTFTPPYTAKYRIYGVGPGGDGTGQLGDADPGQAGGGGGAHSYVEVCLTEGVPYSLHVGAASIGGDDHTTFSSFLVAAAGGNAVVAVPGTGGQTNDCVGDVVFAGGNGGLGGGVGGGGGGGGGAGGSEGIGLDGNNAAGATGGSGGDGGPPDGGDLGTNLGDGGDGGNVGVAGGTGLQYGGGGGGGGFGAAGGGGFRGRVRVTWGVA